VNVPGGRVRALLPPVTFTDTEAAMGDVPALGEQTDQILGQLGYGPNDIASLRAGGAV